MLSFVNSQFFVYTTFKTANSKMISVLFASGFSTAFQLSLFRVITPTLLKINNRQQTDQKTLFLESPHQLVFNFLKYMIVFLITLAYALK